MINFLTNLLTRKPVILQLLRFACIGALNTALDFIILNLLTDALGIQQGSKLWFINAVGVVAAILQSYYWNKHWAFAASETSSLLKRFIGLVLVGGLGFAAFVAAVWPSLAPVLRDANLESLVVAPSSGYFGGVLLVFMLLQLIFGVHMGFRSDSGTAPTTQFGKFLAVSLIGVVINSSVLAGLVFVILQVAPTFDPALAKNIAKLAAVFVALAWNFVGYKFFVFRA